MYGVYMTWMVKMYSVYDVLGGDGVWCMLRDVDGDSGVWCVMCDA